jgi:hypothetical protein
MLPIEFQRGLPAHAGDPLLRRQQALAWATASGTRDDAPDDDLRAPTVPDDAADDGGPLDAAQLRI